MNEHREYTIANTLSEGQIIQLHAWFQHEWWSAGRSLSEVNLMLANSDLLFAVSRSHSHELLAFARVLTDRVFKALIFDVIVHPDHRSAGLGALLMRHMVEHPVLSSVRHIELYCLSERTEFYTRFGFTNDLGDLRLMRRITSAPT